MNELTEAELSVLVEALVLVSLQEGYEPERLKVADRLFEKAYDLLLAHHRYNNTI